MGAVRVIPARGETVGRGESEGGRVRLSGWRVRVGVVSSEW